MDLMRLDLRVRPNFGFVSDSTGHYILMVIQDQGRVVPAFTVRLDLTMSVAVDLADHLFRWMRDRARLTK